MDLSASDYTDFINLKLSILRDMHKNVIEQTDAIRLKDDKLLKKLMKKQQKYYENLNEIALKSEILGNDGSNTKNLEVHRSIQELLESICGIIKENIDMAEKFKDELSVSIKHIRLGENALKNGYYKSIPQQYGYFIDKKIGTNEKTAHKLRRNNINSEFNIKL